MPKTIRAVLPVTLPLVSMGRSPSEGVPFRALEALVEQIKAALPDEAEQKSCIAYGTEALRFEFDNHLTAAEELELNIQELQERQREARGLLPRYGETLRPEELARLRQLLEA